MISLPDFLLKITKVKSTPKQGSMMTYIVIQQPYDYLEKELRSVFGVEKDVKVVVNRRFGERRTGHQPITTERRHVDRRRSQEEIVTTIISA